MKDATKILTKSLKYEMDNGNVIYEQVNLKNISKNIIKISTQTKQTKNTKTPRNSRTKH